MDKSPDAFRTISEVADWLDTPTHVLRFWESRFTHVKPVKRAGGRRYYRPADMELLGGIKKLLHDDGMTIRGVQKLLREEGVKHVAALSKPLDSGPPAPGDDGDTVETTALPDPKAATDDAPMISDAPQAEPDNVVPLSRTLAEIEGLDKAESPASKPSATKAPDRDLLDAISDAGAKEQATEKAPPSDAAPRQEPEPVPAAEPDPDPQAEPEAAAAPEPEPQAPPAPRPAVIDLPPDPQDDDTTFDTQISDVAAMLRQAAKGEHPAVEDLRPLYDRLLVLRDRMASDKRT